MSLHASILVENANKKGARMTDDASWFSMITGFAEAGYEETRRRLSVQGGKIVRCEDGRALGSTGRFETPTLAELRNRALPPAERRTTVHCIVGNARALHGHAEFADALFQVASQFNCLEMTSPKVTPEHGVTGYIYDRTQGPACAIAAGLGTIYRNYFVPLAGTVGQTKERQIDNLADVGTRLSELCGEPGKPLWTMKNGYCLASAGQLRTINGVLLGPTRADLDAVRSALRIGLHHDVEVTDVAGSPRPLVTQAYCSALPVGYSDQPAEAWAALARLVLEATYEATLLAAAERAAAGRSRIVLLTRVGGGVFANADAWISDAIVRALRIVEHAGLDVRLVNYRAVNPESASIERNWQP